MRDMPRQATRSPAVQRTKLNALNIRTVALERENVVVSNIEELAGKDNVPKPTTGPVEDVRSFSEPDHP